MKKKIAKTDVEHSKLIRNNVNLFIHNCAKKYDGKNKLILDIAPQDYKGAKEFFTKSTVYTLDIDPKAKTFYTADICKNNHRLIPNNYFDYIVCTEVLEHTLNPFSAIEEIYRILKPSGYLFMSVPFNFRIHGPLPDCWRFTIHGIKELLKNFKIEVKVLEKKNRFLMPIHYTIIAKKLSLK